MLLFLVALRLLSSFCFFFYTSGAVVLLLLLFFFFLPSSSSPYRTCQSCRCRHQVKSNAYCHIDDADVDDDEDDDADDTASLTDDDDDINTRCGYETNAPDYDDDVLRLCSSRDVSLLHVLRAVYFWARANS